eukprot:TRINITY_DN3826_c0_g1_i1.p1 TRINITY_DN3826_c0_g1~~TRINITY_DN3826_c0_g1_i1.p1  ORF type:complete len:699 (+),score=247.01 TRINITY_DN3826_c0_g1_i1:31-2127(+)
MPPLTSAASFLALLDEEDEIKYIALQKLDGLVDEFWAEIASDVQKIEQLYEDDTFPHKELAALVASKVYYHLGESEESMNFALGAGSLFDVTGKTEYVETLVSKFIDNYIKLRLEQADSSSSSSNNKDTTIDPRLERIVMGMFNRCFEEGEYKQALGIAMESRRLDKVEESLTKSSDLPQMLEYAIEICKDVVKNRDFRHSVLRVIVKLYQTMKEPDYTKVVSCLIFLSDSSSVASILDKLVRKSEEQALIAYQIAFDLYDNSSQQFRQNVTKHLSSSSSSSSSSSTSSSTDSSVDRMEEDKTTPSSSSTDEDEARMSKLKHILTAETSINLHLDFLYQNSKSDLAILKNIKNAIEPRNSVCHSATIFSNAIMHAGTTRDTFLSENLDWLRRATNWAKFSVIAGQGVIHKGHLKEGLTLLGPYLPASGQAAAPAAAAAPAGTSSSPYSEGGALYALGIIHANHGEEITEYLSKALAQAVDDEIVQHGACLGLGVAAMATGNDLVYEELKTVMFTDGAVAGEAAGLAMGLVMLGTASSKALDEMVAYAHETQHEKIIRGLAMGIALVMYGREEGADTVIEQLLIDKDPLLRYGAMYTIGLAYCGTGNNGAIRKLLHVAVSDVNDDVRRAAVANLGFLLSRQPARCPKMVALLCESYNPYVRHGATIALGVSCAASASKEAIELLEPLTSDPLIMFVRAL